MGQPLFLMEQPNGCAVKRAVGPATCLGGGQGDRPTYHRRWGQGTVQITPQPCRKTCSRSTVSGFELKMGCDWRGNFPAWPPCGHLGFPLLGQTKKSSSSSNQSHHKRIPKNATQVIDLP